MNKDEEIQRHMMIIEQCKEQMNTLEMQNSYLQAAYADYNKAKLTLENLEKTNEKEIEMLIPIGGGALIDATAKSTDKVLMDIGAGLVSEKTYEEAIKKIDERLESLQKTQDKLNEMIERVQAEATQASEKAQKLLSEQQK